MMAEPQPRPRARAAGASGASQSRQRARAEAPTASAPPRQRTRAPRARPVAPPPAPQAQAQPPQSDGSNERSLGDLFSDLTDKLRTLVQREIELARIEMKDEIAKGVKGVGMFAGAGITGFVALLLVAMAAAWGLAEVVEPGLAFLIVGVVFGAIAGVLALQGKKKLQALNPVPHQTLDTVKQDVQVAKESLSEGVSSDGPSDQTQQSPQTQAPAQWPSAGADQYARRS
jgi:hypothetical protein